MTPRRYSTSFAEPSRQHAAPIFGDDDDRDRSSEAPFDTATASGNVTSVLQGCKILVVDDNQDGADSLALMLELLGAVTTVAYDGETALDQLDAFQPHVLLLDITLPGLSGEDVARTIRQCRPHNDIVIIAVTGWGRQEDRTRSLAAGFDYHLVKPVDLHTLRTLLIADPRICPR